MSLLLLLNQGSQGKPERSRVWYPSAEQRPAWIEHSPSVLLIGRELLEKGRLLSELDPRSFELLIGELLERDGWTVTVTRGSKDGGIDVISSREDPTIGPVKAIWQAKRYSAHRKVCLAEVRELAGLVDRERASKGVLVTTSSFTRDALSWVRQDEFRLNAKDGASVSRWVLDSDQESKQSARTFTL